MANSIGSIAGGAASARGDVQARKNALWNASLSLAAAGIALVFGLGLMVPALDTGKFVAHVGLVSTELSTSSENGLQLGLMARDCMPGAARCPYIAIEYDKVGLQLT